VISQPASDYNNTVQGQRQPMPFQPTGEDYFTGQTSVAIYASMFHFKYTSGLTHYRCTAEAAPTNAENQYNYVSQ
jgi:hypothetical protein